MHRRYSIVTAGVLAVALVAGGSALAQGPGPGRGFGHRGGRVEAPGLPLRQLNLTEQQRQQVRDIQTREREQSAQLRDRLRQARQAQREAIVATPVDENRIRTAVQDLAAVEADLAVHQAQVRAEVLDLLTPAQREQLAKLTAQRRERPDNRRQQRERRQQQGQ